MSAASPLRIFIGDRSPLFRDALSVVLEHETIGTVVGSAATDLEVLTLAPEREAQIALVDSDLPREGGMRTCTELKRRLPHCSVVLIDNVPETARVIAALEAGADGYVAKTGSLTEVVQAVERSLAGETYIPPGMLGGLLQRLIQQRREETRVLEQYAQLSRREKEVLALVVDGLDDRAMSERLYVSRHTIRTHIQNSLEKLGVHSRSEAVALVRDYDLGDRP